jgi:transposase
VTREQQVRLERYKAALARGETFTFAEIRERFGVSKDTAGRWVRGEFHRPPRPSDRRPR